MPSFRYHFLQLLLLGCITIGTGQSKVWYFGNNAGVDFSKTPAKAIKSPIETSEGCAIVSNSKGKVLLSTDGTKIFDQDGRVVFTSLKGSPSSTHSAIVVPHPANPCSHFFIFTVPSAEVKSYSDGMHVVEVTVNDGDIDIKSSRKLLDNSTEKLAATDDGEGGYWVLAHDYVDTAQTGNPRGKQFFAFHITANTSTLTLVPRISETSTAHKGRSPWSPGNYHNSVGQMKFNQNGDMLALTIYWDQILELFRFNKKTGEVYELAKLDEFSSVYPERSLYGVEFSESGHFLYASSAYVSAGYKGYILGFDIRHLYKQLIWDSREVIAEKEAANDIHYPFGALQMGPDGKIHVALPNTKYLGTIDGNRFGAANQFQDSSIALMHTCLLGLPTLIKVPDCSYGMDKCQYLTLELGDDTAKCEHDTIVLGVPSEEGLTYKWNTGDETSKIMVTAGGSYTLTISDTNGCEVKGTRVVEDLLYLAEQRLPMDTLICEEVNASFTLSLGKIGYEWLDGTQGENHEAHVSGSIPVRLYGACDTLDHFINLEVDDCRCKVFVPNAFTPDGDESNDRHVLKTSCALQDFKLTIFNRWGTVVFETTDIARSWDGTYSGSACKGDVYVYKIAYKAKDNEWQYDQGTVTVLR